MVRIQSLKELRNEYLDKVLDSGLDLNDVIEDLVNCLSREALIDRLETFDSE